MFPSYITFLTIRCTPTMARSSDILWRRSSQSLLGRTQARTNGCWEFINGEEHITDNTDRKKMASSLNKALSWRSVLLWLYEYNVYTVSVLVIAVQKLQEQFGKRKNFSLFYFDIKLRSVVCVFLNYYYPIFVGIINKWLTKGKTSVRTFYKIYRIYTFLSLARVYYLYLSASGSFTLSVST